MHTETDTWLSISLFFSAPESWGLGGGAAPGGARLRARGARISAACRIGARVGHSCQNVCFNVMPFSFYGPLRLASARNSAISLDSPVSAALVLAFCGEFTG